MFAASRQSRSTRLFCRVSPNTGEVGQPPILSLCLFSCRGKFPRMRPPCAGISRETCILWERRLHQDAPPIIFIVSDGRKQDGSRTSSIRLVRLPFFLHLPCPDSPSSGLPPHPSTIFTPLDVPSRVAPAAIIASASARLRTPPDALTPMSSPTPAGTRGASPHRSAGRSR